MPPPTLNNIIRIITVNSQEENSYCMIWKESTNDKKFKQKSIQLSNQLKFPPKHKDNILDIAYEKTWQLLGSSSSSPPPPYHRHHYHYHHHHHHHQIPSVGGHMDSIND